MNNLTPRQKQILDFVTKYKNKKGYAPSHKEIGKHFKLTSSATINEHLGALINKGYVNKEKHQKRSIEIPIYNNFVKIPLLGIIAAGEPIEAIEEKETIVVPKNKLPDSGNIYALRVKGNSMIEEKINSGDIVLVKEQNTAKNGEKVVALIDNREATLKTFYKEKNQIRLQPANKDMEPIIIKKNQDFAIQGTVIDVIKNQNYTEIPSYTVPLKTEIKKYNLLPLNQIMCGDALQEIKKLPDKSIDVIFTDPPYGLRKEGIKNDDNLDLFYSILPDSYRVLRDDSFLITFFSTKFLPDIFKNNPFKYFWNFVLYCPNGRVMSPIGFTKYMSCIVFKKGNPRMAKKGKDIFLDTPGRMIEPDEGFINHPTPKPKTFTKELLELFSKENDTILDPFIGSGSTAVACKQLKRNYIGFEISKNYCELAEERLKKF